MLDIQHISKTFNVGTVNEKRAVTDLSLHLDKGDFVTVIGSNGAGKSTLFNAIAGSFYVDEGRILLNGKDITFTREHDRSRVIGRLFQDPLRGTAPHMSIEENLALAYLRAAHGNPFSRITAKDRELFRAQLAQLDMGLEDRLGQPVGLLSGGQRQALTLLMATMVPPELLLLDEHTAALDPGTAEKVLALTQRVVAEHHITCLMVTHNMTQALALGNRTLMMADGGIVLDVAGAERAGMTVEDLIERFRAGTGRTLVVLQDSFAHALRAGHPVRRRQSGFSLLRCDKAAEPFGSAAFAIYCKPYAKNLETIRFQGFSRWRLFMPAGLSAYLLRRRTSHTSS